jgi:hypothetical protein
MNDGLSNNADEPTYTREERWGLAWGFAYGVGTTVFVLCLVETLRAW